MVKIGKFIVAAILSLAVSAGIGWAGCLQDAGVLAQNLNCVGLPQNDKFFDPMTFVWNGRTILAVNDGNEIRYWNISNPQSPTYLTASNFNIPNQGDSDYDLINYSFCDNCRYGVAVYKLGIVVWDQGTGINPSFGPRTFYPINSGPRGAFTYKDGADQYVIASDLPGDVGISGMHYRIDSTSSLYPQTKIDCPGYYVVGGIRSGNVIYLGMYDNWLYIYRIDGAHVTYISRSPIRAFMGRGKAFAVSGTRGVSGFLDGGKFWDLTNPIVPVQRSFIPGSFKTAAINGNLALLGGNGNSPKTFSITNIGNPVPLDQQFWDPSNPWNNHGSTCEWLTGAVMTPQRLYLSRYSVFQQIDTSACSGPVPTPTPTRTPTLTPTTPTPTPTPPPWPPQAPTCIPGCVVPSCN